MENIIEKAVSPFLTMFSILYVTFFSFKMHFKMSTICFSLDQSKILLTGNGLKGNFSLSAKIWSGHKWAGQTASDGLVHAKIRIQFDVFKALI